MVGKALDDHSLARRRGWFTQGIVKSPVRSVLGTPLRQIDLKLGETAGQSMGTGLEHDRVRRFVDFVRQAGCPQKSTERLK
jgi:hypothetical protein